MCVFVCVAMIKYCLPCFRRNAFYAFDALYAFNAFYAFNLYAMCLIISRYSHS